MDTVALIVASLLMAVGIPLALVPLVPAVAYMFVVSLAFGFYDGFALVSVNNFLVLASIVGVSVLVDNLAGVIGAKYGGARARSLFWGIGGALLGTLAFSPFGSILGLFAGVFVAELYYRRTHLQAAKAASGALLGSVAGMAVNVFLGIAFLAAFLVFALI